MNHSFDSQLDEIIERDRAQRERTLCLDSPDFCNLCGKSLSADRFVIDGEVNATPQITGPGGVLIGEWAYVCAACFSKRGVGIGWGHGQLYERTPCDEWLLVAGFPPDSRNEA